LQIESNMNHYPTILKDTSGNNYLGIQINSTIIDPFIEQMRDILGEGADEYINLQQNRDGGKYHITILNVMEFNQLSKEVGYDKFLNHVQHLLSTNIDDIRFLGLGKAEKSGNTSYFVVIKSELLKSLRDSFNLDEKDFHITIGFKWKDVHGVRKNEVLKVPNKFLKKLKSSFFNEGESFEFIKGLANFDYNFFKLIEPISINDSSAVFRCGNNDYLQLTLIDDRLTISGKWQDTKDLPILSDTLVQKKFKQI
jgi:hypothetical protein